MGRGHAAPRLKDSRTKVTPNITNTQGDLLQFENLYPTGRDRQYCSDGFPVWVGTHLRFCAILAFHDAQLNEPYAPSTNTEHHYIYDACGNLVASGSSSGWTDTGAPAGYISTIAGSSTVTIPATALSCYGSWTGVYTFSETYTDGQTLSLTKSATFPAYRSESEANAARFAQAALTGGPIGSTEQLGGCGATHSTHAQATSYPVDTATGNFWHTFTDLSIPGRGPAISVERSYNSALANTDSPFGYGWSDGYGQSLDVGSDTVLMHGCSGSTTTFTLQGGSWTAPPRVLGSLTHNGDGTWTYNKAAHESNTFDATGRLTSITDLNGETTSVTYPDPSTRVITDPSGRTATFTFDNGHITALQDSSSPARNVTYGYDANGNLTDVIDIGGGHWTFTYDDQHRMITMRTPRFYGVAITPDPVVTNHYDTQSRVDWQSDQLGRKTTFDYTTIPGSTIVTNPAGNATEYDYNSDGLLIAEVRGYGSTNPAYWAYRYDPDTLGRTVVVDGNGKTWTSTYEPDGDRSTQTDPLGRVTSFSYNSLHEVTSITSPRKINGQAITTQYTYDTRGNIKTQSRPLLDQNSGALIDTALTSFEYSDPTHPGDLTAVVDPNGHRTTRTYDSHGYLQSVTEPATPEDPDGNKTTYRYDPNTGWLTGITSPRGNLPGADPTQYQTTFGHNAYGQVTWTRTPLWNTQSPTANQTVRDYDADGNTMSFTDGNGNTTSYTYDAAEELTTVHRADGTDVLTSYMPDGNVDTITDAAQDQTKFDYDPQGRLSKRTDPLQRVTTYTRDGIGNVATMLDARNRQTSYTRNALGQVTGITFSTGGPADITNITYDEDGHRTAATDASGTSTWTYDSLGRLVGTTDGHGATTAFHYDLAGRQKKIDYPGGAGSVTRTFDDADRISSLTDLAGKDFTFTYDADSNPAGATYPNGTETTYTVNAGNQITSIAHAAQATPSQPFASFNYTYDGASQVKTVTSSGVPTDDHTYSYDALGQLKSVDSTQLNYDAAGNITKGLDGLNRAYDRAGELTSIAGVSIARVGASSASGSSGTTLTLSLPAGIQKNDQAIVAVSFPVGKSITGFTGYTFFGSFSSWGNKAGQVALYRKTLAAGETDATLTFQGKFDKSAVLVVYRNVDPNTPVWNSFGGGATGTALSIGGLTAKKADRLLWIGGASGTAGTWTAPTGMNAVQTVSGTSTDAAIADQTLTDDGATGARDATHSTSTSLAGALVALQPASTTYTWFATGQRSTVEDNLNPNGATTASYTFDTAGELASSTVGSQPNVTYTYNADGLRSSKTVGSVTTDYSWDQSSANPQMLSDGSASYVYGPFGEPLERATSATDVSYYAQDRLGSTRAMTDGSGAVQATYTYDAYGRTTAKTGNVANPLTYTGQYQDDETGYLYLRTRYYDPSTSTFLSRDPLENATASPYTYADNNPTNLSDPSGLCPPCAFLAAAAVGAAIDFGMQVLDNLITGCDPLHDINWSQVAITGGISGVTGDLATWWRAANSVRPAVTDARLGRALADDFRGGPNPIGDGSALDAARHTVDSGELVGGSTHLEKAVEMRDRYARILRRGGLSSADQAVAQGRYDAYSSFVIENDLDAMMRARGLR